MYYILTFTEDGDIYADKFETKEEVNEWIEENECGDDFISGKEFPEDPECFHGMILFTNIITPKPVKIVDKWEL